MVLTDHVVAVLVLDQLLHWANSSLVHGANDFHDPTPLLVGAVLDALLYDVAGKLVPRVHNQLRRDDRDNLQPVLQPAVDDDVLGDIVSVLVDYQVLGTLMKLFQDVRFHWILAMLEHALNDPTTIRMRGQMLHLVRERIDDETDVLGRDALDSFLNDMVAILILDTLQNLALKFLDQRGLLVGENVLKCLVKYQYVSWAM